MNNEITVMALEDNTIATLYIDNMKLDMVKPLARVNGIKPTKRNLVNLALHISIAAISKLDNNTFKELTGFKNINYFDERYNNKNK